MEEAWLLLVFVMVVYSAVILAVKLLESPGATRMNLAANCPWKS
jgi:hypothetical protein